MKHFAITLVTFILLFPGWFSANAASANAASANAASANATTATTISLNGKWDLAGWEESAVAPLRAPAPLPPNALRLKATVPGNCELDLVNSGHLPPMEVGMNVRKLRAWEGHSWLYSRNISAPTLAKGERAVLKFNGVDTFADYFLNGKKFGESSNMLIPHEFDVTELLKPGTNCLQVLVRSAFYECQRHTVGELGFHMDFADNEPLRKAAHMGGWDIFPRIYCAGIWRGVSLEVRPPVIIDNVAWISGNFSKDFKYCNVQAMFRLKGPVSAFAWGNRVRATLSRGGKVRAASVREYVAVQNMVRFNLSQPDLWWPCGMGEPSLYDAKIEILDGSGKTIAVDERKIGIRLIQLERDDIYGKERSGQFRFVVNGEPCYIRGSNWVPVDAFHGRDASRVVPTLELFADLNCNMVRVWGGGVYEDETFFNWCDEHGLMVWQDFMTGCAVFPQDDAYAKATEIEVREVVTRLRNHASLALWAGNNENDNAFRWHAFKEFRRNPNEDRNSRRTIPDVLWEMDVSRPYLPSSPYEPPDVVSGKAVPSEMHLWGAREYYKTPFYTNSPCWFASEMGYHGCPSRSSLERMMTKECVYPWKGSPAKFERDHHRLDWNDEWRFKASDPYMRGSGLWRRNDLMTNQIRLMFGGVDTDLDTFIEQSQFIQAEAMKTFCEIFRAGKFTRKNGLIWWNVRDGWPQLSDAVVDYYGTKKKAYFALRHVQQNQLVMLGDDHVAWAVNDRRHAVKGHASFVDKASAKVLFDADYEVASNSKTRLGEIPFDGQGLIEIRYTADGETGYNHFLYGKIPFKWEEVRRWTHNSPLWR